MRSPGSTWWSYILESPSSSGSTVQELAGDPADIKKMTVIQDIYFISCGIGFIYIVGSALLGTFHTGHTAAHGTHGHGGTSHAGAHGGSDNAGVHNGSVHAGNHGGSGHTNHAGDHGGSGHSETQQGTGHAGGRASGQISHVHCDRAEGHVEHANAISQTTTVSSSPSRTTGFYLKAVELLSPTKLSLFLFLFGAIGVVCLKFLPVYLSLLPAAIGGWVLANWFFHFMGRTVARMDSSTNFRKESLIGSIGELTLSVQDGSLGEVVVSTGTSRYTAPARARKAEQSIKKLTKVIIVDIKDGIFLVEPFEESSLIFEGSEL